MHLPVLSWSSFTQYSAQYSSQATLSKQWTAVREDWILLQWLSSIIGKNIGQARDWTSNLLFSSLYAINWATVNGKNILWNDRNITMKCQHLNATIQRMMQKKIPIFDCVVCHFQPLYQLYCSRQSSYQCSPGVFYYYSTHFSFQATIWFLIYRNSPKYSDTLNFGTPIIFCKNNFFFVPNFGQLVKFLSLNFRTRN